MCAFFMPAGTYHTWSGMRARLSTQQRCWHPGLEILAQKLIDFVRWVFTAPFQACTAPAEPPTAKGTGCLSLALEAISSFCLCSLCHPP